MKKSEAIKLIEEHVGLNKQITKKFVGEVSLKILKKCEELQSKDTKLTLPSALYIYLYGRPKCPVCGEKTLFRNSFKIGFSKHCSSKCAGANPDTIKERESTCLSKYGETAVQKVPKIRKKFKKTMLKNHGVEYTAESKKLRSKMSKTCKLNYGVDHPMQSEEVRAKVKKTMVERYGAEYLMQVPEFYEKFTATMIERYGVPNALLSEKFLKKAQRTMRKNFGVSFSMHSEEIKEKYTKTMLERYGEEHNWSVPKIRANIRKTMRAKYGASYLLKNPEFVAKMQETMLELYGVKHALQSKDLQKKFKKTSLKHFGTSHPRQSKVVKDKIKNTMLERYGVEYAMQNQDSFDKNQKSAFTRKKVKINGKVFSVQGYEPQAIKYLVSIGCTVDNILVKSSEGKPSIKYTLAKREHWYHPDMYIKLKNKWTVIEVKSVYTLFSNNESTSYSRIQKKAKACLDQGYRFKLILVTSEKVVSSSTVFILEDIHKKTLKQLKQELQYLR